MPSSQGTSSVHAGTRPPLHGRACATSWRDLASILDTQLIATSTRQVASAPLHTPPLPYLAGGAQHCRLHLLERQRKLDLDLRGIHRRAGDGQSRRSGRRNVQRAPATAVLLCARVDPHQIAGGCGVALTHGTWRNCLRWQARGELTSPRTGGSCAPTRSP